MQLCFDRLFLHIFDDVFALYIWFSIRSFVIQNEFENQKFKNEPITKTFNNF